MESTLDSTTISVPGKFLCIFDDCPSVFKEQLRATEHIVEARCSRGHDLKRNDPFQFSKMVSEYTNKVVEEAKELKKKSSQASKALDSCPCKPGTFRRDRLAEHKRTAKHQTYLWKQLMWGLLRKKAKELRDTDKTFKEKSKKNKKKIREIEDAHWREDLFFGRVSQVSYDLWKQNQDLTEKSFEAKPEPKGMVLPEPTKIELPVPKIEVPAAKPIEGQPEQGLTQWPDLDKILAVNRSIPWKSDAEWVYRKSKYTPRGRYLSAALKLDTEPELYEPLPGPAIPGIRGKLSLGFAHQASEFLEKLGEEAKKPEEENEEENESMEATEPYLATLRVKHAGLIEDLTKAHDIATDRSRVQREMRATWKRRDGYLRKITYNYGQAKQVREKQEELDEKSKELEEYFNS